MKIRVLAVALVALVAACNSQNDIITENVENAKIQVGALLEAAEAGDTLRIPSTYKNGKVEFVPADDWVSGFFAGTLWYMYELTGDEFWAEHAQKHTEILNEIQYLTWHHDVGFMVYDSYGNGLRLKNIEEYKPILVTTAESLCTRFRPGAGVLQSWNTDRGWQALRGWTCPVIIDNMMNLELLFEVAEMTGDEKYRTVALSHADKTIENHYRDDWSTFHVVDYDMETGEVLGRCTAQGYSDDSAWARGQAWSIYGYTVAYRYTKDPKYLEVAENVYDFLFNHPNMPEDLVPYWDFNAPDIPDANKDVSSASIIASALYELSYLADNQEYKATADRIVESLSKAPYRAEQGTNGGFILTSSVGSIPHGSNIGVPLNYADYYFLEALVRKGKIEKGLAPVEK